MQRLTLLLSVTWFLLVLATASLPVRAADAPAPTFESTVRPILKAHCFQCHGVEGEREGGLDLRLKRLMAKGGESGPAIMPGNSGKSLLQKRITSGEMPPEGNAPLTPVQIAVIARWIDAGAKTAGLEPENVGSGLLITAADRSYWAFQPIRRPKAPTIKNAVRVRTPIDSFVLSRLEEHGGTFSPDAARLTLLRRAYFDLLGLPPTPDEVDRFLADDRPDAWERLIDHLSSSPHYGERWGRHWLDVAGYADSEGYTNDDTERQWAWKYRDYVIRSFNADKPFDEFIQEQLAGDEMVLPPYENLKPEEVDKIIATGFLRMAPDGTGAGGVDQGVARNQVLADTINIVSSSLLGITVGCAQCHEHRYDPIPQADYYRMRAMFEPGYDWKNWRAPRARLISLYTDADRKQSQTVEVEARKVDAERLKKQAEYIEQTFERELAKLPEEIRVTVRAARDTPANKRTDEQTALIKKYPSINVTAGSLYLYDRTAADELKKRAAEAAKVRATKPKEEFVRALTEIPGKLPKTFLFFRGDPGQPKQELQPAGLTILTASGALPDPSLPAIDTKLPTSGRRLAYARRLTDGKHPLVARVLVNRIWMHHFGRGIVSTPGDLGMLGERPTHPQLLDWLADEFMAGGWSVKHLHRLIMTSTVYRQSSQANSELRQIDPDNHLYGRMPMRRLEAEAIRDAILSASGRLNLKRFGPPVAVMADRVGQFVIGKENLNAGRPGAVIGMNGEEFRRSVYVQVRRSRPLAVLDTFDMPRMDPNCDARATSTVAPQALMLMNNGFVVSESEALAARVIREAGDGIENQVRRAWKLTYCRDPNSEELGEAAAFLSEQIEYMQAAASEKKNKQPAGKPSPKLQALASFCQTLLGSNEFLYVE
jgi:mono/diheme cytochrome c family protein